MKCELYHLETNRTVFRINLNSELDFYPGIVEKKKERKPHLKRSQEALKREFSLTTQSQLTLPVGRRKIRVISTRRPFFK